MKSIFAAIPLVLLAACQTPAQEAPKVNDQCGLSAYQNLVGTTESSLDKSALPKGTRVILPGMPVTRDYRRDRLNIYVDKSGVIERVVCG